MKPQVLGQDHSTGPNIHSILKMQDLKRNFLYAVNNMLEVRIFIQQLPGTGIHYKNDNSLFSSLHPMGGEVK